MICQESVRRSKNHKIIVIYFMKLGVPKFFGLSEKKYMDFFILYTYIIKTCHN